MIQKDGVQSVSRALNLLKLLATHEEGARVSDLAVEAELAVSTTHRLLTTMEQMGFVQLDRDGARWQVGRETFAVGQAYARKRNLIAPAMPLLKQLRDATRETANLGILDDAQVVTVAQVESREIMRAISPPGGAVPIFCSGMGKAMAAEWPDTAVDAMITRTGLPPMTPKSLRTPEAVRGDILHIREAGYAIDDEENATGLRCISAAVVSPSGEVLCAISISGLAARVTQDRIPELGKLVAKAAKSLSTKISPV